MLQIINGPQIATDDYYIQHLSNGRDELHFEVSLFDPAYYALNEEARILETTEGQTFTVTLIDAGERTAKIGARLDLCDWQNTLLLDYSSGSRTASALLSSIAPSGWSVEDQTTAAKKTHH